jgi:hypothetical protein
MAKLIRFCNGGLPLPPTTLESRSGYCTLHETALDFSYNRLLKFN